MAKRPVFIPTAGDSLVQKQTVEFKSTPGVSIAQKQRSIASLHQAARKSLGLSPILEVSTKSPVELGIKLSAFTLELDISGHPQPVLVEAAYQGSKVFTNRGPFTQLYDFKSGGAVKRFIRQHADAPLTNYRFENQDWALTPRTAFYDWLYIKALQRLIASDESISQAILGFKAFTDIEFNPETSRNCQAWSCALYVALQNRGLLEHAMHDSTSFIDILQQQGQEYEELKL